ncbi:hypothetical protein [Helicobacter cynogastricus]|uniref:hypothetical protein n=1 Tax=Helicobacter cynogastricus TaxID=329937 RepID=UPI00131590CD|nr:hypothetical protein [Helicobacter cynogastricus]
MSIVLTGCVQDTRAIINKGVSAQSSANKTLENAQGMKALMQEFKNLVQQIVQKTDDYKTA